MTFLLLYFGCEINRKTADGMENWAKVIHKESVGITKMYNAIPCSLKSLDKSILLNTEKTLVMRVLPLKIINQFSFHKTLPLLVIFLYNKYVEKLRNMLGSAVNGNQSQE